MASADSRRISRIDITLTVITAALIVLLISLVATNVLTIIVFACTLLVVLLVMAGVRSLLRRRSKRTG